MFLMAPIVLDYVLIYVSSVFIFIKADHLVPFGWLRSLGYTHKSLTVLWYTMHEKTLTS